VSKGKRQDDAGNARKKRRWLWPLLIISLGLNLLFVGLVAVGPLRKQIREARRTAEAALLADTYNEEKVAQALGQLRTIKIGMHQSMHTMMMGLLKDLTLMERRELVKQIHAGFRHRRIHRRTYRRRPEDVPGLPQ